MSKSLKEWSAMSKSQRSEAGFKQAPTLIKATVLLFGGLILIMVLGAIFSPTPELTEEEKLAKAYADSVDQSIEEALKRYPNMPVQQKNTGVVLQVQNYLAGALNDWSSYEPVKWFNLVNPDGTFYIRHRFRANNALGAKVLEDMLFRLDSTGTIISVK